MLTIIMMGEKMKKISLQNDMMFKSFFGRETVESKKMLINLINAVLKREEHNKIISIEHKNPFNLRKNSYERETILDIKAVTNEHEYIDIEMQTKSDPIFIKRSLLYWSKLHGEQYTTDIDYKDLKKSICINILGDELIRISDEYHFIFKIMETKYHEVLCEDLEIHYIQLPRISDIIDLDNTEKLVKWMIFIKDIHMKNKERVINDLADNEDIMELARSEYNKLTEDPFLMEQLEAREKFIMDQHNRELIAERKGLAEGLEKGLEQGLEQGLKKVAKSLKSQGFKNEEIVLATGLSVNEIDEL